MFVTRYTQSIQLAPIIKGQFTKSFHNSIYQQRNLQPYPLDYLTQNKLIQRKVGSMNGYYTFVMDHEINKSSFAKFLQLFDSTLSLNESPLEVGTPVLVFETDKETIRGIIHRISNRDNTLFYTITNEKTQELIPNIARHQLVINTNKSHAMLELTYKRVNNFQRIQLLQQEIDDYLHRHPDIRELRNFSKSEITYYQTKYLYSRTKIHSMIESTINKGSSIQRKVKSNGLPIRINLNPRKQKQKKKPDQFEYNVYYDNLSDSLLLFQVYQFFSSVFFLYGRFVNDSDETAAQLEEDYQIELTYQEDTKLFKWLTLADIDPSHQLLLQELDEEAEALQEKIDNEQGKIKEEDQEWASKFFASSDEDDSSEAESDEEESDESGVSTAKSLEPERAKNIIREQDVIGEEISNFLNFFKHKQEEELVETHDLRVKNPQIYGKLIQLDKDLFGSSYGPKKNKFGRICQPTERHPIGLTDDEKMVIEESDNEDSKNGDGAGLGNKNSNWCDSNSTYEELDNCKGIKWGSYTYFILR